MLKAHYFEKYNGWVVVEKRGEFWRPVDRRVYKRGLDADIAADALSKGQDIDARLRECNR